MKKRSFYVLLLVILLMIGRYAYAEGYVIGEEDMLQITVWGNHELSVHLPVRPDGMITLPLVGDVKAAGLTPQELKKNLEKTLAGYVKTPVVSVMVTAVNSFKVYIFGGGVIRTQTPGGAAANAGGVGASSGQLTLKRNTTLMQLLAQLGSLDDADLYNAYLSRDGKKLSVNIVQLVTMGDLSQDVKLEPNDIIYLPGGIVTRIRVIGEVKTPGLVPFSEGMTALDAVLSAGGFTEFASRNGVMIVRKAGNEVEKIEVPLKDVMNGKVSKNIMLKRGDIVTIKSSIF